MTLTLKKADGGTVILETLEGNDIEVTVNYTDGRQTTMCISHDQLDNIIDLYNGAGYTEQ